MLLIRGQYFDYAFDSLFRFQIVLVVIEGFDELGRLRSVWIVLGKLRITWQLSDFWRGHRLANGKSAAFDTEWAIHPVAPVCVVVPWTPQSHPRRLTTHDISGLRLQLRLIDPLGLWQSFSDRTDNLPPFELLLGQGDFLLIDWDLTWWIVEHFVLFFCSFGIEL
jgi:hypothetical protein